MQSKSKRHILFITSGYPYKKTQKYTFLDSLVCAMANRGEDCTVIYPVSLTHSLFHREELPPKSWIRISNLGKKIKVLSPRMLTFSSVQSSIFSFFLVRFNQWQFDRAVDRALKGIKFDFDLVYGHFLVPSGLTVARIGGGNNIASCVAYGENSSYTVDDFGPEKTKQKLDNITAVISVSSSNTEYLTQNNIIPPEKIKTIPNAVNRQIFYPRGRLEMRKKYGFPADAFIVAFVGYFTNTKGSARLSEALDRFSDIYSLFIGSGPYPPNCKNVLHLGSVVHEKIPELLSTADIFVLPTLEEGCCNAIIEALSCNLPVVSSELPFNDDILNEYCSVRIDTSDIDAIYNSIRQLKDNPELRQRMSKAASDKAKELDIDRRAELILDWIAQRWAAELNQHIGNGIK